MFDEKAQVTRILGGDLPAFGLLVQQYQQLVFYIIDRLIKNDEDKKDVTQEVFIKVFKSLKRFHFESKLSTWIASIAYRTALNYLRDHPREKIAIRADEMDDLALSHPHPGSLLEGKDIKAYLFKCMEEMPAPYKMVILLYHINSFSYEEIAEVMGLPEGTVKSHLFRSRKLLKERLKPYLSDEKTK